AGVGYAALQYYRTKHPWSKGMNTLLFSLRAFLAFFLAFLLLGPIVKQIANLYEKPAYVILQDNSSSIREAVDSAARVHLQDNIAETQQLLEDQGYDAQIHTLAGDDLDPFDYAATTSDINSALRRVANQFE